MLPRIKDTTLDSSIHVSSPLQFEWYDNQSKSVVIGLEGKGEYPKNAIFVGKVKETSATTSFFNANIWFDVDFPSIILICGRRGTGKSYTLGVIAEGLAAQSDSKISTCNAKFGVLVVDTLGQFWQMRYSPKDISDNEHVKLLNQWDLEPTRFENVEVYVPKGARKFLDDWKVLSLKVSDLDLDDWCGLLAVDRYGSRIGQLMGQVYEKVVNSGYRWAQFDPDSGNVLESRDVPAEPDYEIDNLIECLDHDREINSRALGFEVQTIRALRSRLVDLQTWQVFDVRGSLVEEIFEAGKVAVLNLQDVDYSLKNLIVGILIKKIFKARAEARALDELKRIAKKTPSNKSFPAGWILIDEAHNYCPEGEITAGKEWLIRYAKEGRSLGLGLITTTQQPSALSAKLSSQINILISHGLSFSQDISAVESRLLNDLPESLRLGSEMIERNVLTRILRSLSRGDSLISASGVNRVFFSQTRPRISVHGGAPPKVS